MCLGDIIIMEVYMIISATGLLAFSHLWLEDSLSWKQLLHIWRSLADWSSVSCCPLTSLTFCFPNLPRKEFHSFTAHDVARHLILFDLNLALSNFIWCHLLHWKAVHNWSLLTTFLLTGTQWLSVKWHLTWSFLLSYSCRKPALYFGLSMLTFSDAFVVILCSIERL